MGTELSESFAQVRAAYRLLWAYHRRLADMIADVDEQVSGLGFEFQKWEPWRSGRLGRPSTPFWKPGKWAWDMMPGMAVHAWWTRKADDPDRQWLIAMWTDADGGFGYPDAGGEPDPSRDFDAIEESASVVSFYLWDAPAHPNWTIANEWCEEQDWGSAEATLDGKVYRWTSFKVDLPDLPDRPALKSEVLDKINAWWREARAGTRRS